MLIVGIWHGAGLQFIIFGIIHGVCMTLERAWILFRPSHHVAKSLVMHCAAVLRMSLTVLFADIFFRSTSVGAAVTLLRVMAGLNGHTGPAVAVQELWPLLLFPIAWFLPNTQQILGQAESGSDPTPAWLMIRWRPSPQWALVTGLALFLVLINLSNSTTFLYFQF
jgi:hypothetical protein